MRNLLVIISLFALSFESTAQLNFGIKAGTALVNTHALNGEGALLFKSDRKIAYQFGLYTNLPLSEKAGLNTEILISNKGEKLENSTLQLLYLNFPVYVNYYIVKKVSIIVGGELGYLFSAKRKNGKAVGNLSNSGFYNKIDYSVFFESNYELNKKYAIGIRYLKQISTLIDRYDLRGVNGISIESDAQVKNNVVQLSISYKLN